MSFDSDAQAYIAAVESADGAALPANIKKAIDSFVVGCKADSIWSQIKSACFLAGPRTLAGALIPLAGPAPTNISGNFVSSDYNQLTGLKGNGSTKALDTNRNNNSDPQNNAHQSVWVSQAQSVTSGAYFGSGSFNTIGGTHFFADVGNNWITFRNRAINADGTSNFRSQPTANATGFIGHSRSVSTVFVSRLNGASQSNTIGSSAPANANNYVFARNASGVNSPSNSRLAWYSSGESIDLALLDARLTTYMAAIATPLAGISTIVASHYAALGI